MCEAGESIQGLVILWHLKGLCLSLKSIDTVSTMAFGRSIFHVAQSNSTTLNAKSRTVLFSFRIIMCLDGFKSSDVNRWVHVSSMQLWKPTSRPWTMQMLYNYLLSFSALNTCTIIWHSSVSECSVMSSDRSCIFWDKCQYFINW